MGNLALKYQKITQDVLAKREVENQQAIVNCFFIIEGLIRRNAENGLFTIKYILPEKFTHEQKELLCDKFMDEGFLAQLYSNGAGIEIDWEN